MKKLTKEVLKEYLINTADTTNISETIKSKWISEDKELISVDDDDYIYLQILKMFNKNIYEVETTYPISEEFISFLNSLFEYLAEE